MLKMAAILKSKMAATGTNEKNGNNLICIPGSLLHHLRPNNQIVHEPPTNNISNQTIELGTDDRPEVSTTTL